MMIQTSLSTKEVFAYFIVWTVSCFYSLYCIFEFQEILLEKNDITRESYYFQKGWSIIKRPKDTSDIEWRCWQYYIKKSVLWLSLHFFISEILRYKNEILLPYWYIGITLMYTLSNYGYMTALILLTQPAAYFLILLLGAKTLCIWMLSVFFLIGFSLWKFHSHFSFTYVSERSLSIEEYYIILICISWMTLRCISFSLDHATNGMPKICHEKKNECSRNMLNDHPMIIRLLSYCLYLPLLFTGPIILYDSYEKSFDVEKRVKLPQRIYLFSKHMSRYMGWYIFTEGMLHFFYVEALQKQAELIFNHISFFEIFGAGLWMGFYFYLKYLMIYGISCILASMDHIDAPPPPRCIGRIHLYSHMWRYFDVGLYKFIVKYMYIPVVRVTANKIPAYLAKIFSSFFPFFFFYFWHGMQTYTLIWAALNYMGIILENIGHIISKSASYDLFVLKILRTKPMRERFNALVSLPLLLISAISNLFFFGGEDIGFLYTQLFFTQNFNNFFVFLSCLYSCCHVSAFLSYLPARTVK